MSKIFDRMVQTGVVSVVRTPGAAAAIAAIEALERGGLSVVEITLTTEGAIRAVEQLADRFGDRIVLGAGTVLDPETARIAMLAGAQFIVTPSLNPATIEMSLRYSKPVIPGALTPTEVLAAWQAGATAVKVFPCHALGGASYLRALKGPFPQIELIPSGGVNLETTPQLLRAGACAVAAGAELVDAATIASGDFQVLERRAAQYLDAVRQARTQAG